MQVIHLDQGGYRSPGASLGRGFSAGLSTYFGERLRREQQKEDLMQSSFLKALEEDRLDYDPGTYEGNVMDLYGDFKAGKVPIGDPDPLTKIERQLQKLYLMGDMDEEQGNAIKGALERISNLRRLAAGKRSEEQEVRIAGAKAGAVEEAKIKARSEFADVLEAINESLARGTETGRIKSKSGQVTLLKNIEKELETVRIKTRAEHAPLIAETDRLIKEATHKVTAPERQAKLDELALKTMDLAYQRADDESNLGPIINARKTVISMYERYGFTPPAIPDPEFVEGKTWYERLLRKAIPGKEIEYPEYDKGLGYNPDDYEEID